MLIQLLPMILVACLGFGLKRAGVLHSGDARTIGKLLTTLVLPAVILRALATATITPELIYLPLSALVVVVGLTAIAFVGVWWFKWDKPKAGALMTTFPTFEGGAVGYPIMLLTFGDLGLSRIVLFDLAQAIYLFTVVYCLSAWFGQAGVTGRAVALKLAQTPFFWAIVLGLILNALGWMNEVLLGLLNIAEGSFLLLVLLLLGMEFQVQLASVGRYALLVLAKIGCGLSLGWAVTQAFGLQGVEQAAVLAGAALPPSLLTLLFAKENDLDTRFVISFISTAVPLYLAIVIPLLVHLSLSP
ncbi:MULTISPECIES: AEC family transporter [Cyanophyceae]|uniref:AEC family transporter n=1 Tax=Cyanophyceae TaxID=3028117 RepID=UPI00168594F3|nr:MULTISPECIES: AEC family transporter [Cyanophyceae]MBD1918324.1 AEC family transporter [Phormidium sp. FACHB-77]MBD2028840.1 AEC family transporter [Phormidium sp. FACHB-322]MBD2051261.1 AEC family transporter [Leptolyngbya sp. FACHB-60]